LRSFTVRVVLAFDESVDISYVCQTRYVEVRFRHVALHSDVGLFRFKYWALNIWRWPVRFVGICLFKRCIYHHSSRVIWHVWSLKLLIAAQSAWVKTLPLDWQTSDHLTLSSRSLRCYSIIPLSTV
jgi:hypothetical protein